MTDESHPKPRRRGPAAKMLRACLGLLIGRALLELGCRVVFAIRVGPSVLVYGTGSTRLYMDPTAVGNPDEAGVGYTKYRPNQKRVDLDRLTGERVAIKIMRALTAEARRRLPREIAALRMLDVPGVVRLLDEGPLLDGHFLVLAFVDGTPFPGPRPPVGWGAIRETVIALLEVLGADYVRTARAKGLSERVVIARHALRNALIPVITIIGLQLGSLLGGAVVTEKIFSWPGLGTLLLNSIQSLDFPVVQACILLIAAVYVVTNMLVDVVYGLTDPRVKA